VSEETKPVDPASLHRRLDELEHAVAQRVEQTCAAFFQTAGRTAGGARPAWQRRTRGERRWQVAACTAVAIGLQVAVPGRLAVLRPVGILPALQAVLLLALLLANPHRIDRQSRVLRMLGLTLAALISFANAWSVVSLAAGLVRGTEGENAGPLLVTGGAIWLTNVIVFGLWYWEFDRGGPVARALGTRPYPDFQFVQMSFPELASPDWEPAFADYLYLAFTNAAAFWITDRCDAAVPLGEARHDPAVGCFHRHGGTDRGTCRQHPEIARPETPAASRGARQVLAEWPARRAELLYRRARHATPAVQSAVAALSVAAVSQSQLARLAPAVTPMQPVRDPLERLARQGRRFPAHPALAHPDHPVQVDPGRPVLAVPRARADRHKVALAVVVFAG